MPWLALPLALGMVVALAALITVLQALCFGPPTPDAQGAPDGWREAAAAAPLWLHLAVAAHPGAGHAGGAGRHAAAGRTGDRMSALGLIRAGTPQGARPFERFVLTAEAWAQLPAALGAEPSLALLALWAEPGMVHAAFLDDDSGAVLLASAPAEGGRYAALSPARPGAIRFERADPRPLGAGRGGRGR